MLFIDSIYLNDIYLFSESVSQLVSESVSQWISQSVCQSVSCSY